MDTVKFYNSYQEVRQQMKDNSKPTKKEVIQTILFTLFLWALIAVLLSL